MNGDVEHIAAAVFGVLRSSHVSTAAICVTPIKPSKHVERYKKHTKKVKGTTAYGLLL